MSFKNIRIKKRGGGTRLQRVQVLKSGKFKFVKNIKSRVQKVTKRRKKSNPKRRKTRMARRRRGRRRYSMTIPLAPIAGLAVTFGEPIKYAMAGDMTGVVNSVKWNVLGVQADGSWNVGQFIANWMPTIAGALIHKFVGGPPLNVNRLLARAKVPFIRI